MLRCLGQGDEGATRGGTEVTLVVGGVYLGRFQSSSNDTGTGASGGRWELASPRGWVPGGRRARRSGAGSRGASQYTMQVANRNATDGEPGDGPRGKVVRIKELRERSSLALTLLKH